jgi:hypothetical protein
MKCAQTIWKIRGAWGRQAFKESKLSEKKEAQVQHNNSIKSSDFLFFSFQVDSQLEHIANTNIFKRNFNLQNLNICPRFLPIIITFIKKAFQNVLCY